MQNSELDDEAPEPPVPPNLGTLSASLQSLVEFLRISVDLLDVAAEGSTKTQDESVSKEKISVWVAGLPAAAKDEILVRIAIDGEAQLQNELVARYDQDRKKKLPDNAGTQNGRRRTAAELLASAEKRTEARLQSEAEKAAEEKARREREAVFAREKHLNALVGREPRLWTEIEQLVATKQPKNYDKAIQLLVDLRDLATRKSGDNEFNFRLENFRETHTAKPSLLKRLRDAGM